MIFRKYVKGDVFEVLDPELFAKFELPQIEDIDESLTWSATEGIFVLGCGGFRRFWNGVYEAWLIVRSTNDFRHHKIEGIKFIKQKIKELKFHRIQASVILDHNEETNSRFLFYLGFNYEGILKQYGPDKQDYNSYSLVK